VPHLATKYFLSFQFEWTRIGCRKSILAWFWEHFYLAMDEIRPSNHEMSLLTARPNFRPTLNIITSPYCQTINSVKYVLYSKHLFNRRLELMLHVFCFRRYDIMSKHTRQNKDPSFLYMFRKIFLFYNLKKYSKSCHKLRVLNVNVTYENN